MQYTTAIFMYTILIIYTMVILIINKLLSAVNIADTSKLSLKVNNGSYYTFADFVHFIVLTGDI